MVRPDIRPFGTQHWDKILKFCDTNVGHGYFKENDLQDILEKSQTEGLNASFIAYAEDEVVGVRFTFAPGKWINSNHQGVTPLKWKVPLEQVAYFKSLFIAPNLRGQRLGPRMSKKSIDVLKQQGARAIVCHSWKESPGNSSQKYLLKLGFEWVNDHPKFWAPIDYLCSGCQNKPCQCTAQEMIYYLKES